LTLIVALTTVLRTTVLHCDRQFVHQNLWPWTILNSKIWAFSDFLAILSCGTHFKKELSRNGWNGDRPRQPAYEISSIKHRFQQSKFWLLGLSRPARADVKEGYPLKSGYYTAIGSSGVKTVADTRRHTAYHNRHWWRAF